MYTSYDIMLHSSVNKINGRTFLRLPNNDKLREKLDLSIGGEELLISIAEEVCV